VDRLPVFRRLKPEALADERIRGGHPVDHAVKERRCIVLFSFLRVTGSAMRKSLFLVRGIRGKTGAPHQRAAELRRKVRRRCHLAFQHGDAVAEEAQEGFGRDLSQRQPA